jgi:hypothetical protein
MSSQRTGSTALIMSIANTYNINYFVEPFEQNHKLEEFKNINTNFITHGHYVVKFMADQLRRIRPYKYLIDSSIPYKIKLYRENTVAQIASMYIANVTGNWYNNQVIGINERFNFEMKSSIDIPIDIKAITNCIKLITTNNRIFATKTYKFDLTIKYESLDIFNDQIYKKSIKPNNYNEILKIITDVMISRNLHLTFTIQS